MAVPKHSDLYSYTEKWVLLLAISPIHMNTLTYQVGVPFLENQVPGMGGRPTPHPPSLAPL